MKVNGDIQNLHTDVQKRENLEQKALGSLTTEIIKKLNISIENLPQKCQNLLEEIVENQTLLQIDNLESTSMSLYRSKEISNKLQDDYEILKLKQKNAELQAKIDRNNKFLDGLRKELVDSKESLSNRTPNPDNIQEHIRQLKQKLAAYEESYIKAKSKYSALALPEVLSPACVSSHIATLLSLREEAHDVKQRADDVTLVKEARHVFSALRRVTEMRLPNT